MLKNLLIDIRTTGNNINGHLSFFETNKDIPFSIKRVYYTYDVPMDVKRGMHVHKELQQLIWCPYGEIEVVLDDGVKQETFLLDSPDKGLLVLKGYWHDMYWRKEGSILCAVASDYYNEEDYIRDYDEFQSYVEKGYWNNES